jgi:hypothetical protein
MACLILVYFIIYFGFDHINAFICNDISDLLKMKINMTILRIVNLIYDLIFFSGISQGYPRITVNPNLMSVEKGRNTIMKCEATPPGPHKEPVRIEWFQDKIPVDLSDPRLTVVEPGILVVKIILCFNDHLSKERISSF